ncbi:MAG: hypothetical protein ACP5LD_13675 [Desulfomonilaceae bacterium]
MLHDIMRPRDYVNAAGAAAARLAPPVQPVHITLQTYAIEKARGDITHQVEKES